MGVVQAGSDRPRRDPERLGDLRRLEPEVVVEHEDSALVVRETPEATLQLVPVHEAGNLVGSGGAVGWEDADGRRHPGSATSLRVALVHDEARRPRDELVGVAEVRQLPPRTDQRLLERVLRQARVPQDPLRDRVQSVAMGPSQDGNASRSPRWAAWTRSRSTLPPADRASCPTERFCVRPS